MYLNSQNVAFTINRIFLIWNQWEIFDISYRYVTRTIDRLDLYKKEHPELYKKTLDNLTKNSKDIRDALEKLRSYVLDLFSAYPAIEDDFDRVLTEIENLDTLLEEYKLSDLFTNKHNKEQFGRSDLLNSIHNLLKALQDEIIDLPLLSDGLGNQVTSRLILLNPQSSVQTAFAIFEDFLRQKMGGDVNLHGQNLINLAYGNNGTLDYGETSAERQGARDLLSGAYGVLRNPRMHRIIKDDYQVATSIISLVDLMLTIVDESEAVN